MRLHITQGKCWKPCHNRNKTYATDNEHRGATYLLIPITRSHLASIYTGSAKRRTYLNVGNLAAVSGRKEMLVITNI